jgi:hypothetical protein
MHFTNIVLCLSLLVSSTSFADSMKKLYGYINLDRNDEPHFVAVDLDSEELTAALPMDFFDDAVADKMMRCMDQKTTHVITVEEHAAVQNNAPTSIPGRTTTTHFPVYKNVRCENAPGFLEAWRNVVRNSRFR